MAQLSKRTRPTGREKHRDRLGGPGEALHGAYALSQARRVIKLGVKSALRGLYAAYNAQRIAYI